MNDIVIKNIGKGCFDEALSLVWDVFQEYEAPDYSQEGIDEFYKSIHDENYLAMLSMLGAFLDEQLVGVIATRSEGAHIALFFVDRDYHRQVSGKSCFKECWRKLPPKKLR